MALSEPLATLAYVLSHPTRQAIVRALKEAGDCLTIPEVATKVGMPEEIIGFHMLALKQHGLVTDHIHHDQSADKVVTKFTASEKVTEAAQALNALA